MLSELNDIRCDCLVFVCNSENDSRTGERGSSWRGSVGGGDEAKTGRSSPVYDRFLLFSKFLKLAGLIFISANSIECSWPFQWNQLIPCGKTERAQMMGNRLEKWDIQHFRFIFPHTPHRSQRSRKFSWNNRTRFSIILKVKNNNLHNVWHSVEHLM